MTNERPSEQSETVPRGLGCTAVVIAFRQLREAWFVSNLASHAHEREWEDEDQEKRREASNQVTKQLYDKQTEMIVNGDEVPKFRIAPTCGHDLWR